MHISSYWVIAFFDIPAFPDWKNKKQTKSKNQLREGSQSENNINITSMQEPKE